MILDIYKDSFEYSAQDWKTLVILGVMAVLSFLLLPVFLVTGYNYRVINTAVHGIINGKDPLPDFDDLVGMFVDGIKVVIVQFAYVLVPIIVFLIFAAIASYLGDVASVAAMIIGSLITFILVIICCLMVQMGLCHMAYNDGAFSKAFAVKELMKVIDDIGWVECIATYLGLIIITLVIAIVVTTLIGLIFSIFGFSGLMLGADTSGVFLLGTFINWLVSMFLVGPYLSIFNSRSLGLLYSMQIE
ncbi:DUF4013 domain-containing protein [Methanobrevibacter sp.]|uniref:DUF4013 domain-containing protein n=1 Tax=Methanobrevibacter sp. TaxID=66852 RepID=UPI00388D41AC